MILSFINRHKMRLLFVLGGAVAGYCYYFFIGCSNGTCMIASNPIVSVPYFALIGYIAGGIFKTRP